MSDFVPATPISPLRQRLIDDMTMRQFSRETQRNYIGDVGRFATFVGRRPDAATAEDVRRFQVEQRDAGVPVPTMNGIVSALRFFFTHTVDRPDLARMLVRVTHPRKLPVVLSSDKVARLVDLKDRGIRVNLLAPGNIKTPALDRLVPPEHQQAAFLGGILPRLGSTRRDGQRRAFLASDESAIVNGAELLADGGLVQI